MGKGQAIDGNNHQRLIGAGVGLDGPETATHGQMTGVRATLRPVPPRRQPQMGVCRNGLILRLTDHVSNHPTLTTLGGPK